MAFFIGIFITGIMLLLLPNNSYKGNKMGAIVLLSVYSLMYFYILQYGVTIDVSPFIAGAVLIIYLIITHIHINKRLKCKEVLQIGCFVMVPIALCVIFQGDKNQFHFIDLLVIAMVIAMNQMRFVKAPLVYQANTIEFYGLSITFHLLVLYIFLGYRKIDIHATAIGTIDIWVLTLGMTFLCCLFAALVGTKMGYLSFSDKRRPDLRNLTILCIFNFFHVAIAEEAIFRGFVYNYLLQYLGKGYWLPLILTTLLFGCHHISFGGKKMFVLSSIAGFFYGLIYVYTTNIFAAAFIHAVTNIIWRSCFMITNEISTEKSQKVRC